MDVTNFKSDFDKQHYIIVVLQNSEIVSVNDLKANISDYNTTFHKLENLSVRSFILDRQNKTPAILIRKFKDKDKAMDYFTEVNARKSEFVPGLADFDMFAISQSNYRELIKIGSASSYMQFFDDNYSH